MSPTVTLGLFAALGYLPKIVQDQLFDHPGQPVRPR